VETTGIYPWSPPLGKGTQWDIWPPRHQIWCFGLYGVTACSGRSRLLYFLASDDADAIRGQAFSIDGGTLAIAALCITQVGSLFSADGWNNITFIAGEVKNPQRNVPLSLALGTCIAIVLYVGANIAYAAALPLDHIQHAPADRVAGAMLQRVFPSAGAALLAVAIVISAFGCANGLLLSGARAYFAMARDGLFFRRAAGINRARVPGAALMMQGAWASALVLARTYNPSTRAFGNLCSNRKKSSSHWRRLLVYFASGVYTVVLSDAFYN
jgi:amino acid transporter